MLKVFIKNLYVIVYGFLIIACCKKSLPEKEVLKYNPNWTNRNIIVSEGGGFTGFSYGYKIYYTGEIYNLIQIPSKPDSLRLISKMQDSVITFFSNLDVVKFDTINYYNPGNLTYSLSLNENDSLIHSVSWSMGDKQINSSILKIYKEIFKFTERIVEVENIEKK